MCYLRGDVNNLVLYLQSMMHFEPEHAEGHPNLAQAEWEKFALLVLATETEGARAVTYLEDTGDPKAATGRLLLRAAERSLRATGDTPARDSDKQEGDEADG